jgi:hypothetical protein
MLDRLVRKTYSFDGLLNTREAAGILGVAPRTLEFWRSAGKGPTYSKIGRAVRYSRISIEKFVKDNERVAESEFEMLEMLPPYLR